jgi:hypothetical protein
LYWKKFIVQGKLNSEVMEMTELQDATKTYLVETSRPEEPHQDPWKQRNHCKPY